MSLTNTLTDIERLERKVDTLISLMQRIVPADMSKEELWRKEFEDLKKRSRRIKVARNGG